MGLRAPTLMTVDHIGNNITLNDNRNQLSTAETTMSVAIKIEWIAIY